MVPGNPSAQPQMNRFHMIAAGKFLDAGYDFVAMVEKLVAHDGVAGQDDQPVPFDHRRMGIGGIGFTDDQLPLIADGVLGRVAANLMFLQELLEQRRELLGGAAPGARRIIRWEAAKVAHQFFGEFAELMGLFFSRHDCRSRTGAIDYDSDQNQQG